ncbi:hypothetical protein PNOK_0108600 [Pyrrhoderma noxium]|uniref:Late embryogenesis abundant protein LEA-2 subgroup domain-containing protein n=1 Tax=Pyrrhoderma noxium TaxID=2282107 RepID=A0A286UWR0_9AGAM|nr:hypothetical protein PNOK_0108600 [Pyrrhoderma noxium]
MSYQDPYYSQNNRHYDNQQPYSDYNPYSNTQQHPTYDQSGYRDDEGYPSTNTHQANNEPLGQNREKGKYEEMFPPVFRPPESTGAIRVWRKDQRGALWTKGGRGKCVLRFLCCSILLFIFLLLSVVFSLALWIRPPDITINQVGLNSTGGSAFEVTSSSLVLNLGANISVANPNYFSVNFKKIVVDLTYPINNTDVGGGEKDNIVFKSHTQTTFQFPFTLTYNLSDDTNKSVLEDLLSKCGITGTKENIDIDYKITLGIRILFITVSPSFSNSFSFECPVDSNDLSSLLSGSGISISSLTG